MKKFMLDIIIMTLIFITINILTYEFIINNLIYKEYDVAKIRLIGKSKFNKYIFGDSHGWRLTKDKPTINEKIEHNNIFNFAYGSDSYGDILVKLQWLKKVGKELDTIFLSIDDHMLTKTSNNSQRTIIYSNYYLHNQVYDMSYVKFIYYKLSRYFPIIFVSNQKILKKYLKNKVFSSFEDSKINNNWNILSKDQRLSRIEDRIVSLFPKGNFKPNNRLIRNLKDIIEFSHDNEIVVIGVKFPICTLMTNEIDRLNGLDKVEIKSVEFGIDTILDYRMKFGEPVYLIDQDHVNYRGALELSNELIETLR